MQRVFTVSKPMGTHTTAPGAAWSRSQRPAFDVSVGAGGYAMPPLAYSRAIAATTPRYRKWRRSLELRARRTKVLRHVTLIPASTATPHRARTLNRADARMTSMPNTERWSAAYTGLMPSGPSDSTTPTTVSVAYTAA